LERALSDVPTAIDIVPWWTDATDARYQLNRALCLMWTAVRWRRPATPDEREIQDEVLRILKRGVALDPRLPWPWPEWLELLKIRGIDDAVATEVAARASTLPAKAGARHPIGYRRGQVLVVWSSMRGGHCRSPGPSARSGRRRNGRAATRAER
jgi:hypothetical protein